MSHSVKQERPFQRPLFYRGLFHLICKALAIDGFCYQYKLVNHSQTVKIYRGYIE